MKIKEIKSNQGKIYVEGIITEISEPREFATGKVANAKLKDEDNDEITLVLWNEQIDQIAIGNKIKLENGYAKEWNNQLQISTGKFGTLEVLDGENKASEESEVKAKEVEEEIKEKPEIKEKTEKEEEEKEEETPKEPIQQKKESLDKSKKEAEDFDDADLIDSIDIEEDNL